MGLGIMLWGQSTFAGAQGTDAGTKFSPEEVEFYQKQVQPIRKIKVPEVKEDSWARNPIDKFILEKLQAKALRPADEADKRTLIRRAYLDVTGLPPGAEEVERFIADPAPDAYDKLVDQLL